MKTKNEAALYARARGELGSRCAHRHSQRPGMEEHDARSSPDGALCHLDDLMRVVVAERRAARRAGVVAAIKKRVTVVRTCLASTLCSTA